MKNKKLIWDGVDGGLNSFDQYKWVTTSGDDSIASLRTSLTGLHGKSIKDLALALFPFSKRGCSQRTVSEALQGRRWIRI
jgi:hypothetical protein